MARRQGSAGRSLDALIDALVQGEAVVEAVRAAMDPRGLVHEATALNWVRKQYVERQRAGDALAARFGEGDEDLRRDLMEVVLEMTRQRTAATG